MSAREMPLTSPVSEHEWEPVRGLPGHLPKGESLLWQGAPHWWTLACRGLHVRALACYFAIMLVWRAASAWQGDVSAYAAALRGGLGASLLMLAGLALAVLAMLALFAWLSARTTVYSMTDKRIVLRYGVAMQKAVNVPFALVSGARLRANPDGTGDIALVMESTGRLPYMMLWPHVRPFRFSSAEPMLRAIPDAAAVAQRLARALAATGGTTHPIAGPAAMGAATASPQPLVGPVGVAA